MTPSPSPTVVVIGGGITGLAAARRITHASSESRVVVLEREARLGGKLLTHDIAGVPVEAGADWFVTRQPAAVQLCRDLGLDDDLVAPERTGAALWSRGNVTPLPPGLVRGIPTDPSAAARAGVLSRRGALRASLDLVWSRRLEGPDISVGAFVRRRFGNEVLERLVGPLLAASRSGSPDDLSLAAAAPEIDVSARSNKSVIRGLRRASAPIAEPFLGLRGGMRTLLAALRTELGDAEIRTDVDARLVRRTADGYEIDHGGGTLSADAVVIAVPAPSAAGLVGTLDEALAQELGRIEYAPGIVATLVYPAPVRPPAGSGMLVPTREERTLTACAWFSEKWAHARPEDGSLIVRCFVSRASALTDEEIVGRIVSELEEAVGLGAPVDHLVTRWNAALPVYRVGHLDLVRRIEERAARLPGVELAGAALRGSGVPDCVLQGHDAADRVAAFLGRGNAAGR